MNYLKKSSKVLDKTKDNLGLSHVTIYGHTKTSPPE
jgi:hypothetical protein